MRYYTARYRHNLSKESSFREILAIDLNEAKMKAKANLSPFVTLECVRVKDNPKIERAARLLRLNL